MQGLFSQWPPGLSKHIQEKALRRSFGEGEVILREGEYVNEIPVVLSGLVKVFTRYEERELLLYYIAPDESCIMSFSSGLHQEPSQVFAQTDAESELLLLPARELSGWMREHPEFSSVFLLQYRKRYSELLDTIHQVLFDRLHVRLYEHLKRKASFAGQKKLSISHQQLADELGTVREVISRTVKKLEAEGRVRQSGQRIEILKSD